MGNNFSELTRVQIPAMVHLSRLGYKYFGKISENSANVIYDPDTNILIEEFNKQFDNLNPVHKGEGNKVLKQIKQKLDNDDLGKSFYEILTTSTPYKLIDFDNPNNNSFYFTGEFTCKRDLDEFRPDITLFINGMPLSFIEVKKPLNKGGMLAESKRMNDIRFPNRKFRRFINITQLMIFSNNMEYDKEGGIIPIQGSFYCTGAKKDAHFNCFREENPAHYEIAPYINTYPYKQVDGQLEKKILEDFNAQIVRHSKDYQTNMSVDRPTNRILTSMCSPERLLFLIKYGIAYVRSTKENDDGSIESREEKHIMRYQQMFAAMSVLNQIKNRKTSGVIWHTQGSGKTALSYFLHSVLNDYYAKNNVVAKYYFIVDRLDLLKQASEEFSARGLIVKNVNSREELMEQFRSNQSLEGDSGKPEITVVNIQKFKEDKEKIELPDYDTNLQRIFIIDEAHRGYNPKGSFLAHLFDADKNSIKIALTGTPLLKEERASWKIFGEYFHTYYYDESIQDGYTLKIIREDIETSYKERLSEVYDSVENLVRKKDVSKADIVEHDVYVKELLRFIIKDLKNFRLVQGDDSLGGMVICETGNQAKNLIKYFDEVQQELNTTESIPTNYKAGIILHDTFDKETRSDIINDFKRNFKVDILFVFNMLLTGFDAPRLKRLYFGRKLKDHNLLQAITRVNRPYKDHRYGYILDFADIKEDFDKTNEDYLRELNRFNDPNEIGENTKADTLSQVLEDKDSLIEKIKDIRQTLFNYSMDNPEEFSIEITQIDNKDELLELKKALTEAKDCFNIVRAFGDSELKEVFNNMKINFLPQMLSETNHAINIMNQKEAFENYDETKQLINEAMKDITFSFNKIDAEELELVSGNQTLNEKWEYAIVSISDNIDQDDPELITLKEAFMQRFKERGFTINNMAQYNEYNKALDDVFQKLQKLKKFNDGLLRHYNDDAKFVRIHKRIKEENVKRKSENKQLLFSKYDEEIVKSLNIIKHNVDMKVYDRNDILKKDAYFEQTVMSEVAFAMRELNIETTREDRLFIMRKITKQYLDQYNDTYGYAA